MSNKTRLLNYIKLKKQVRVEDIRREFSISRAMIHRHLKSLLNDGVIGKSGKPPLVYYYYVAKKKEQPNQGFPFFLPKR